MKARSTMHPSNFFSYRERLMNYSEVPVGMEDEEEFMDLCGEGEMLHAAYCPVSESCGWDEEEFGLLNPWSYPEHLRWLALAQRLRAAGVDFEVALEASDAILKSKGL